MRVNREINTYLLKNRKDRDMSIKDAQFYTEEQLVSVAKRENNQKRAYLVVNRLQGKHVPVHPKESLEMFDCLAEKLLQEYGKEKLLLIGFAETATAIGAAVAGRLSALYIQTTREQIKDVEYFYFTEQHSHATEQKLVKGDLNQAADWAERIIFIEDEITTGDTIWNIIRLLEQEYPGRFHYSAASILNGMTEEYESLYRDRGIRLHWLVKTCHDDYSRRAAGYAEDGKYHPCDISVPAVRPEEYRIPGVQNARRLTKGKDYWEACEQMGREVLRQLPSVSGKKILVVGTEEFMYPALLLAHMLEEEGGQVWSHSTTRSPIAVSSDREYPLHERYELRSLYDSQRKTFLYDLSAYEDVLIVTDAAEKNETGLYSLVNALCLCGNENIRVVRWCED